jgi:hypothetical protein
MRLANNAMSNRINDATQRARCAGFVPLRIAGEYSGKLIPNRNRRKSEALDRKKAFGAIMSLCVLPTVYGKRTGLPQPVGFTQTISKGRRYE